ncbi:MAG: hypothetical protein BGO54_22455 [Sphingobacteriales bacterium 46-32]|nr:MAG: hypothetical protein BGO54_22455 [Sphingobacteriales bacterium 46-32]
MLTGLQRLLIFNKNLTKQLCLPFSVWILVKIQVKKTALLRVLPAPAIENSPLHLSFNSINIGRH